MKQLRGRSLYDPQILLVDPLETLFKKYPSSPSSKLYKPRNLAQILNPKPYIRTPKTPKPETLLGNSLN